VTQNDPVKCLPTDNWCLGANAALAYCGILRAPGLPDTQLATLQAVSFEVRDLLMDRRRSFFGFTLIAEPRCGRVDATGGLPSNSYGGRAR